ncbi:hypothetical protein DJFAAGMI_01163 [Comamonas sp. PE63]|uniref:BON domain-containing protein n=1 Tax=Comamonas brasiliensis TaxID=1812482 RepID=A0ABS5LQ66_9BURK|nr:BON domain-containing protein [Comamonas sp. PE63]MBS3018431.1 hypothetical protein [Comamonas sp. PE63]
MKFNKISRIVLSATVLSLSGLAFTGCSVARHQQSVGSYVDDAGITTAVKSKYAEDKTVAATSISVETMKGVVQLSGFAKSQAEKDRAEALARDTKGVTGVKNSIVVRP